MGPHLVKWHEEFHDRGLEIIEVDHGDIDSLEDLQAHVISAGIPFAVLHDQGGTLCQRFGVHAFPTAYLIGRDGQVLWEGHPTGSQELRQQIEDALN